MKLAQRIAVIAAVVIFPLLTACRSAAPAPDQAGVRKWVADFTKAFQARDTSAVMALYSPDVVSYDVVPPLQYAGLDAYRKDYDAFFQQFKGPITVEYRDMRIEVSGDLALLNGLERISGAMTNGQPVDVWVRVTTGLRKVDGRWLDFQDHISVPANFATGKAALDLKP